MSEYQTIQSIGLLVFALTVGLNAGGLGFDYALTTANLPTVSEWARANPWLATLIIVVNIVGVVGLIMHLSQAPPGKV